MTTNIQSLLGDKAESLLGFNSPKIPKERLHLPGPDFLDNVFINSDRNNRVLNNLAGMYNHGRLSGSGYLSILPVDQGIEHTALALGTHGFDECLVAVAQIDAAPDRCPLDRTGRPSAMG